MFSKTGCPWQDCPPEYGPYMRMYNRFNRWSERGIWQGSPEPLEQMALGSTHVKARHRAGGIKGRPRSRQSGVTTGGPTGVQALADELCRPCEIILTHGGVADSTVGQEGVSRTRIRHRPLSSLEDSGPALRPAGSLGQQLRLNVQRASGVSE
jgi:Putative transposase of IS4/5 family (DUF4096)